MSEAAATTQQPTRECGSCTLCCKLFPVLELDKPAGRWCPHVAQGRGCGIHETRPHVCRAFFCQWIWNEELGPEWKPETARFVLSIYPGSNALAVTVDPGQPAAWRREPYHRELRRWAEAALAQNSQVVVFVGDRATVVLPDRDVELGVLQPGDQISVGRLGAQWEARLVRAQRS
ncbi:MAG: hypothetical protein JNK46_17415 [Methylobacteriaceae bacterium]|nr:hypothetical protein [Methylobacteriaceae bacterium]